MSDNHDTDATRYDRIFENKLTNNANAIQP